MTPHQYIDRATGACVTEELYGDAFIKWLYSARREVRPLLYKAVTGRRMSSLLGFLNYGDFTGRRLAGAMDFARRLGVNLDECADPPDSLNTPRKIFERKIRYWETRPAPEERSAILSPSDSRVLIGSLRETSSFFVKGKFFDYEELLGADKGEWLSAFDGGDFAIFRLTPEKYHYNHAPVSGAVRDHYMIDGGYHSCNPAAAVSLVTPLSKNRRAVTVIDTDVEDGSGVGLVAMIEVAALMIGEIVQAYSHWRYDDPQAMRPGMFIRKGQPKSLFRPGSSTVALLFQTGKIGFARDIASNQRRPEAASRYSILLGAPIVETGVAVRSLIAFPFCKGE